MAAPFLAAATGMGRTILSYGATINVGVKGAERLGVLGKALDALQGKFVNLGVTTIFLDRLAQSLSRVWAGLNAIVGVQRVAEAAKNIRQMADFTGVAADRLQAFASAAKVVGAEMNDVSDLFQTLGEKVDDLLSDPQSGPAKDFMHFGMVAEDFRNAGDALDYFLIFAEKLQGLDAEKRLAAFEKILGGDLARRFGRMGTEGSAGVVKAMANASNASRRFSKAQLDAAERYEKAQHRLSEAFLWLSNQMSFVLLPVLTRAADTMEYLVGQMVWFFARSGDALGDFVDKTWTPFLEKVDELSDWITVNIRPFNEFIARIAQGLLFIVGILAVLALGKIIGSFLIIFTTAVLLANVLDDIFSYIRGEPSFIGEWAKQSETFATVLEWIKASFWDLKDAFWLFLDAVYQLLTGPLGQVGLFLAKVFGVLVVAALRGLSYGIKALAGTLNLIVRILNAVVEAAVLVGSVVGALAGGLFGGPLAWGAGNDPATRGMQRIGAMSAQSGGMLGAIGNAFSGQGPTFSQQMFGGGMPLPATNLTVNQTINANATTPDPAGFVDQTIQSSGRGVVTITGRAR